MSDSQEMHWITPKDVSKIKQSDHWKIQSIEAHQLQAPIGPEFSFLCQWKTSAWKTSDQQIDAFMKSQVCKVRNMHDHQTQTKKY